MSKILVCILYLTFVAHRESSILTMCYKKGLIPMDYTFEMNERNVIKTFLICMHKTTKKYKNPYQYFRG